MRPVACTRPETGTAATFYVHVEATPVDTPMTWHYVVPASPQVDGGFYEARFVAVDENRIRPDMLDNPDGPRYRGKGITEATFDDVAIRSGRTVVSSRKETPDDPGEWRSVSADKLWTKLVARECSTDMPSNPVACAPVTTQPAESPSPAPTDALASKTPGATPAIYDEHGSLFIEGRVGDDPTSHRFIFDTGASASTLSADYATAQRFTLAAGQEVTGTAGTVQTRTTRAGLAVTGVDSLTIDWVVYSFGSYDPACVGILGRQLLELRPFTIDYEARTIEWDMPPPDVAPIEMTLDGGIPRIVGALESTAMDFRIDTGASLPPSPDYYVNLAPKQALALGLPDREPVKVFKATGTGGTPLQVKVYEVTDLHLGSVHVAKAFAIVQPAVGYFAREEAVGFLGNSVLDKQQPHFNYADGVLYLNENPSAGP